MKQLGLIGHPLTHSFSKKYYDKKFEKEGINGYLYKLFDLETIEEFSELLKNKSLIGVNVTIPYKKDEKTNSKQAVNLIRIERKAGTPYLTGFNTDIIGFKNSLTPLLKPVHASALILGNGGAAQAVKKALSDFNIHFNIISRNPKTSGQFAYHEIDKKMMQDNLLVINCSPLGTFPEIEKMPDIPYQYITKDHLFYDLIYNPEETKFLEAARKAGALTKNGYETLVLQAEENWKIGNDK